MHFVKPGFVIKLALAIVVGLTVRWLRSDTVENHLELKRQMSATTSQRIAKGGPKFELPPDQRAGWIAAWNKLRACAKSQGFDGVGAVAASYGDGLTPSPVIAGSGPSFERAMRECAFDTRLFDAEKVTAAIRPQLANLHD